MGAYFYTYLASDIASVRQPISSMDSIEDALMVMAFYAAWGIFYVHMTYPNYSMCVSSGSGYGEYEFMDGPVTPSENGVADVMDVVAGNLPGFDDVISWFSGGDAKDPAVPVKNVYIPSPAMGVALTWP